VVAAYADAINAHMLCSIVHANLYNIFSPSLESPIETSLSEPHGQKLRSMVTTRIMVKSLISRLMNWATITERDVPDCAFLPKIYYNLQNN
jgi:hypothetical protein